MFQKDDLSVFDWFLFYILMAIPLVNIIVYIVILFSGGVNKTLKNMLWSNILLIIIAVILFTTVLAGIIPQIVDLLQQNFPV